MERTSFVFHFEYLHDIPENLRGQWSLFIIDYAEIGVEPALNNWMEQKLWNSIKKRVDTECQEYQKKVANLKQNSRKNLHSSENALSVSEKQLSVTENELSDTEKRLSEGVYVSVYDSVSVSESDSVTEHEFGSNYKNFSDEKFLPKTPSKKTHKKSELVKPTLDEVITYCQEKNYKFNPERFWEYYEDNSWGVKVFNANGKCVSYKPIKDWKSKCDEWNDKQITFQKPPNKPTMAANENVDEFAEYFLNEKKAEENGTNQKYDECPSF